MSELITGDVFDDIYSKAYGLLLDKGIPGVASRVGETVEVLHVALALNNPRQRWCTCRNPAISPAYSFAELVYTLSGSSESAIINKWNPALPKFQGYSENYPGAYGMRLRRHFGFDQLERAYESLAGNAASRQVVLEIWSPIMDLPKKQGQPNNLDIPCNICSMLKIRDGRLYWTQIMRSNDFVLGLPYDVLLFSSLHEIFAGWLSCDVGEYIHFSDSLHMYDNTIAIGPQAKEINKDDLRLEKCESDKVLNELFQKMCELGDSESINALVRYHSNHRVLPEAYHNILMVLCAYAAHKKNKKNSEIIEMCLDACNNRLYSVLTKKWLDSH